MHIPRIRGSGSYLPTPSQNFKDNPELRYVSDGDPTTVSAPAELAAKLGDQRRPGPAGRPLLGPSRRTQSPRTCRRSGAGSDGEATQSTRLRPGLPASSTTSDRPPHSPHS